MPANPMWTSPVIWTAKDPVNVTQSALQEADLVVAYLTRAMHGGALPSHLDSEFNRVLHAIGAVHAAALDGSGGQATTKIGVAAYALLLEALRRSGKAEQTAKGVQLN